MKENSKDAPLLSNISVDPLENIAHSIATTHHIRNRNSMPNLKKIEDDLKKQIIALQNCDLSQVESMLYAQSIKLQDMYLTITGMMWMATNNPHHFNTLGLLALKTQNQCRATLATLANMKNPNRATFIKQQNNAINQQINNAADNKKIPNMENELLKDMPHETLDPGRTQQAISVDTSLEAMEKVDGRPNSRR